MKITKQNTDVLYVGIAKEGIDFGNNFEHDAVLVLEDEEGNKVGSEFISLNEFSDFMSDIYSADDLADLIESKINHETNVDDIQGTIEESEIIAWFEKFRFSEQNKSYYLTEEY